MLVEIKVGQIWTDGFDRYEIIRIDRERQPWARYLNITHSNDIRFAYILDRNDYYDMPSNWYLESAKCMIPDILLDPTLHILQAGYLQDRQRKQFKRIKVKENVK